MAEWKDHFMRTLGGVEKRVIRGEERRRQKEEVEEEISKEEVKRAIRTLREGEASGVDGVP